ncbi:hypothetical protein QFC21_006569 [Naganishia friedmannii]|uniref:Uncharacterized protein n=1 Tax=Naganishia friedmannii TaxID=89922 RepID=A0ACC2V2C5_9TREE|nr:hypothetical protein QFC21_006569 [Naganishia friedmannii]
MGATPNASELSVLDLQEEGPPHDGNHLKLNVLVKNFETICQPWRISAGSMPSRLREALPAGGQTSPGHKLMRLRKLQECLMAIARIDTTVVEQKVQALQMPGLLKIELEATDAVPEKWREWNTQAKKGTPGKGVAQLKGPECLSDSDQEMKEQSDDLRSRIEFWIEAVSVATSETGYAYYADDTSIVVSADTSLQDDWKTAEPAARESLLSGL